MWCKCGVEIPAARLAALPGTKTCIKCSTVKPVKGHMITPHKTGSHIELVPESLHEEIQSTNHRRTYGSHLRFATKR